jgi:hypothetical protein
LILIKKTVHQEDITIVNIYTLNIGSTNFIEQIILDIKAQVDPNPILGDFNTSLSPIDWSSRQKKLSKENSEVNYTTDKKNLTDIQEYFTQQTQNTHSSQKHVGHSPK